MTKPFDVSAVGYVKRVVIGNTDPEKTVNEEDIEKQRQLLNRCLSDVCQILRADGSSDRRRTSIC